MYEYTPREAANLRLGLFERIEAESKAEWVRTRWLAFISAKVMGSKVKTPQDLMPFEWEDNEPKKPTTKDIEKLDKVFPSRLPEEYK